jgi:hypothetical protein
LLRVLLRVLKIVKSLGEAIGLTVVVTSASVGFLLLCGVCTINWSMFIW